MAERHAGDGGPERRLFTAHVERLKATYTFTARSFVRADRAVHRRRGATRRSTRRRSPSGTALFSASVLFAYKLNWQSVLFLGYGDSRTLADGGSLVVDGRQLFLKLSYAFQR